MNKIYVESLNENFEQWALTAGLYNIQRLKAGFVSNDDYVKGIMTTISLHAISNIDIFNKERRENLIGIFNIIRHDRH